MQILSNRWNWVRKRKFRVFHSLKSFLISEDVRITYAYILLHAFHFHTLIVVCSISTTSSAARAPNGKINENGYRASCRIVEKRQIQTNTEKKMSRDLQSICGRNHGNAYSRLHAPTVACPFKISLILEGDSDGDNDVWTFLWHRGINNINITTILQPVGERPTEKYVEQQR